MGGLQDTVLAGLALAAFSLSSRRLRPPMQMKAPEDLVSGDDPMTGAQTSYLKTRSEQVGQLEQFEERLPKAEASKRIDLLKEKLGSS